MEHNSAHVEKLAKSVFVIIGDQGATNFGIVRGEDGTALLIDADIRRVDEIEAALKQTGCHKLKYLFNTHENFDHSSANDHLTNNDATVVSSDGCLAALKDDGEAKFAEMADRAPGLRERFPDPKMGLPQVTFAAAGTISLPGATMRLQYYGQSHSKGDAVAFLEQEQILFAGDLLYNEVHPVTIYGDIPAWIHTLELLAQRRFKRIVPGHGPVPEGEKAGKEVLLRFRRYLEDFYQQLLEAKAGRRNPDEVETYMKKGVHETLGKTYMVKRNIGYFLKEAR